MGPGFGTIVPALCHALNTARDPDGASSKLLQVTPGVDDACRGDFTIETLDFRRAGLPSHVQLAELEMSKKLRGQLLRRVPRATREFTRILTRFQLRPDSSRSTIGTETLSDAVRTRPRSLRHRIRILSRWRHRDSGSRCRWARPLGYWPRPPQPIGRDPRKGDKRTSRVDQLSYAQAWSVRSTVWCELSKG